MEVQMPTASWFRSFQLRLKKIASLKSVIAIEPKAFDEVIDYLAIADDAVRTD